MIRYLLLCMLFSPLAMSADKINILIYHHVAEGTPASTTISTEKFRQHLDSLEQEQFKVVNLEWAIDQIQQGLPVPERAVAITFDDGFADIYQNAFPLLKERKMPFTLFIATDAIDEKRRGMMSWDMIREMKSWGATIANHSSDHDYMVRKDSLDHTWLQAMMDNINHAQNRLVQELGETPKMLAYPYGEYNNDLKKALKEQGWIAFGQQSGGVAKYSDFQALPRFPAASIYSNWNSLKVKLASIPLPIDYSKLPDPILTEAEPPLLSATLLEELRRKKELSCYIEGKQYQPNWLSALEFSVQAETPLPNGRSRYNCTMPSMGKPFYWFSIQWLTVKTSK